ncbi:MAG: carboxypeptidase-like regulatory domain-containing protein, partial [Bacteroidota bacterium]
MLKLKSAISVSLLFSTLVVYSQNYYLSGDIIDSNGEKLPGITIQIENTNIGAITDVSGKFLIEVEKLGTYSLIVSSTGFKTQTISLQSQQSRSASKTITLDESVSELDEVVVQGKSLEQEKREEPIKIEVIDTKKLQVQSLSLPQVINQTAGVKVRQSGGFGSEVNININGLEGPAVRYFKDDIPLDYLGSAFNLSLLPIDQLESIQLYKGALPIKLGIDALGGGVNFVTKQNPGNFMDASVSYGTFNTKQVNLNANYNLKDLSFLGKIPLLKKIPFYKKTSWPTNLPIFIAFDGYHASSDNDFNNIALVPDQETANLDTLSVRRFHDRLESFYGSVRIGIRNHKIADLWEFGYARFDLEDEVQNGATLERPFGQVMYFEDSDIFTHRYKKQVGQLNADFFLAYSEVNTFLLDTATIRFNWDGTVNETVQGLDGETTPRGALTRLRFENWTGRLYLTYDISPSHQLVFNHNLVDTYRIGSDPRNPNFSGLDRLTIPALYQRNVTGLGVSSAFEKLNLQNELSVKRYQINTNLIDRRREFNDREIIIDQAFYGAGNSTKYSFDENRFVRLSYEYTTRIPEAQDYFGDGFLQIQNPDLVPERSHNVNLGYYSYLNSRKNYWIDLNLFLRN